jgi:hypothetical protein
MDPILRTKDAYLKERFNCAQSVLKGFQAVFSIPEERIAEAKAQGGGRAENGRCGALHSALSLAKDAETRERIACAFSEEAGAEACREIRSIGKLKCADCVELAAKLLSGK